LLLKPRHALAACGRFPNPGVTLFCPKTSILCPERFLQSVLVDVRHGFLKRIIKKALEGALVGVVKSKN
jgi:hypothetical protein